ncbi:hypothetical protein PMAC_001060 [Pneumocystis sp. 'macacae']|nr:hypothetical protein PMAC_001060 [Pneumocystis sp. 'macacae']
MFYTSQKTHKTLGMIKQNSARAVARAVKRRAQAAQNDGIDELHILALVLKENLEEEECKKKLKGYCDNLKEADKGLKKVDPRLKGICDDGKPDEKCKNLKTNVKKKCTELKEKLEKVEDISTLKNDDCNKDEQKCLFLEGACPKELTENCNKLRNLCYQKKREKIANEVLLRAIRGSLVNETTCKTKLKKVCLELSQESDELMKSCFYQETWCQKFVLGRKEKCDTLEAKIKGVLEKKNELRAKCLPLLEECYFYRGDCKEDIKNCDESSKDCNEYLPVCDALAEECKGKSIVYIPPGRGFDPTEPEPTVAEDIGLEELYERAAKEGVHIGKPPVRDATALLALLIQDLTVKSQVDENGKCKKVLENRCKDLKEHEVLGDLCNDDGAVSKKGTEKCEKLRDELAESTKVLSTKIEAKHLVSTKKNEIIAWNRLFTFLTEEECTRLQSDCFYFIQDQSQGPLEKECKNIKAACYKKELDALASEALQRRMYGLFRGSNKEWFKKLQDKVVEECSDLRTTSDELFLLCIEPLKAVRILAADIQTRAIFLREQLDKKRDFPGDKDCKELGRKCQELRQDSNEIRWPCYTLEQQCERLGTTELLKALLLSEHKDTLKDYAGCEKYLKEKCNLWARRGDGRFSLVCAFQNATCKLMVDDVQSRCKVFEKNTKDSHIIEFLETNHTQMESLAGVCPFWHPYCDKYGSNCPDLLKGDTLCANLKKYCGPFYTRKALEDALKVELRGKLGDKSKCDPELKRYCTVLKEVNNVSINSLCEDSTKSNAKKPEEIRNKLCEKLIAEVREQCRVLPAELKQKEEDLKSDSKTFNELKREAEKAMEKAKLVLSVAKTGGNNAENRGKKDAAASRAKDTMKHVKIVRRGAKDVPVTELEARALDLAADVLARYVELKERCTRLNSDCGIKDDCDNIKDVCKEIEKTCRDLKLLEIRSQEIVTQNVTTTTTKTVGPGGETVEECKSIKTTDTWVTKTSTHTSTSTSTSTITSTVTLTSTRRCKPTKCTTGDEAGDVTPSGGLKMTGWSVVRGLLLGMIISVMI